MKILFCSESTLISVFITAAKKLLKIVSPHPLVLSDSTVPWSGFCLVSVHSRGLGTPWVVSHWFSHKKKQTLFFIFHRHSFIAVFFLWQISILMKPLFVIEKHFMWFFYGLLTIPQKIDLKKEWTKIYTTEVRFFPMKKTQSNIWINLVANSSSEMTEFYHELTCNTQRQRSMVWT